MAQGNFRAGLEGPQRRASVPDCPERDVAFVGNVRRAATRGEESQGAVGKSEKRKVRSGDACFRFRWRQLAVHARFHSACAYCRRFALPAAHLARLLQARCAQKAGNLCCRFARQFTRAYHVYRVARDFRSFTRSCKVCKTSSVSFFLARPYRRQ